MPFSTFDALKQFQSQSLISLTDQQLHQVQRISLEIMDDVISLCREHGLCWFLGGGSALGALRHQGFIPWDDDIDINMPRRDYDRFIPLFREKYGHRYAVQTPQDTPDFALSMTRIRKKGTVMRGRDDLLLEECGVGLDIFVIENTYDDPIRRTIHGLGALGLGFLLSARKFYRDRVVWRQLLADAGQSSFAIRLKIALGALVSFHSVDWWCKATDNWHRKCNNHNSQWVCGCAGRLHFFGELYRRDRFCATREATFEGRIVNIPLDAEDYLTHCYGDWQEIPETDKREKHMLFELKL